MIGEIVTSRDDTNRVLWRGAVTRIDVWAGTYVDGISTYFSCTNGAKPYFHRGGFGGNYNSFALDVGEGIVGTDVRSSKYVDAIRFRTSWGRTSPYFGGSGGNLGFSTIPTGYKLAGF